MASNLIEFRAGSFGEATGQPRRSEEDDFLDSAALDRVRTYQQKVERASAMLCALHPELIAGELLPQRQSEARRPRWPLILALCASGLVWLGIIFAIAHVT